MELNISDGSFILNNLIEIIQENKDFLSEIDGAIGDGDHGVNMNKGFSLCQERLCHRHYTLSEGFNVLSETLLDDIGGSMGPLYGVMFEAMALLCKGKTYLTAEDFNILLNDAVNSVMEIGGAKRGDKTLLDTLIPAKEAFEQNLAVGMNFEVCLKNMTAAAEEGWKNTKNMVAKIGRASRLGERSRGVLDAGATSCFLLLKTLAESINNHLE